ncbi:MAG: VOC family protein [Candidatus Eremiobacteraeota bacterium]|nr:VOC family protein [Candidatus Eremiobacteraeota bacterium]
MDRNVKIIVFPVKDIDNAKSFYAKLLGVEPYYAGPYYAGFRVDGIEIGLDPNGHSKGQTGPIPYWDVDDIRKSLQSLADAGGTVAQEPMEVGGGLQIAWVKEVDGNLIGLRQHPSA